MTSLTTEDFPYTIAYVMELLGLEERELTTFAQMLDLSPATDEKTGRPGFTYRDVDLLKKAVEMKRHGEVPEAIIRHLKGVPSGGGRREPEADGGTRSLAVPGAPISRSPQATSSSLTGNKDNITMMVEAVSQVKEGILKDLARLLDDKLSGLDEVVVELIRCKSENDSLKKKLNEAIHSKEAMEEELSRFKPVQFGFYRKT